MIHTINMLWHGRLAIDLDEDQPNVWRNSQEDCAKKVEMESDAITVNRSDQ